jgi:hypothetical protein
VLQDAPFDYVLPHLRDTQRSPKLSDKGRKESTYVGSPPYLLNHVVQTSAASSESPTSTELAGVGSVSAVQLDPVIDADGMKGEVKLLAKSALSCRFDCGNS